MRWLQWLLFAAVCASVLTTGCTREASEGVKVGGRVPAFSLKTQAGSEVSDKTLDGQIVVLNFWSTTCGPCASELPALQAVADEKQAVVVGIALDEPGWKAVQPFVAQRGIRYPIVLGDEDLFQRFDGVNIPYTLILDRSQRVVNVHRGAVTKETLQKEIQSIAQKG